jgi:hypothetical protein
LDAVTLFGTIDAAREARRQANNANPYVGETDNGQWYSMEFNVYEPHPLSLLKIPHLWGHEYKVDHRIVIMNGPFAGGRVPVSEERWKELNTRLEKSGETLESRINQLNNSQK